MIKIARIKKKDNKQAYQFCMRIFEELGWDKRFNYGLEDLSEFFSRPKEVFFLAKKDNKIIGCGGLKELSKDKGLIKRFYIAKDFRGKGSAEKMLKKIKEFAQKENYKTVVLDIFDNNIRAKKFFQKQGLKIFKPRYNKKWRESQVPKLFEFRKLELK